MFTFAALPALLAAVAVVRAIPTPTTPGSNAVYNEGSDCPIAWVADPTGTWTKMTIQLMTGANLDMKVLETVAIVDGTQANNASFTWTCPQVSPNAAEYFYQFTSPVATEPTWTTRFTIAGPDGATVPAATPTQQGSTIPWGIGTLVGGSGASATGSGSTSVAASASSSASVSAAPPASSAPSPAPATTAPSSTASGFSISSAPLTLGSATSSSSKVGILSTPSASSSGNSANAAVGALSIDTRLFQTAVALVVAATGFAVLL
ncbi:hypothetical protein HWV62_1438 [Athelia sp. TMB]|nr:hypothetical protein HWV62_1438 [Athelia sp. TMB]